MNYNYGKDAFYAYLKDGAFQIQSTKETPKGIRKSLSYKDLAKIWEPIFNDLLESKSLNLGQLVRNFYSTKNTQKQKDEIIKTLYRVVMQAHYHGEDEVHETIVLGIGMIFNDLLDCDDPTSSIRITQVIDKTVVAVENLAR